MTDNDTAAGAQDRQGGFFGLVQKIIHQLIVMYIFRQVFTYFTGSSSSPGGPATNMSWPPAHNLFLPGEHYDLYVYLHDEPVLPEFNELEPFWSVRHLQFGNWHEGPQQDSTIEKYEKMPVPEVLRHNGSLYMHVIMSSEGGTSAKAQTAHYVKQLNKYKKKYYKKTANLLTGVSESTEEELAKAERLSGRPEILNHWHTNITLNVVYDQQELRKGTPLPYDVQFSDDGHSYSPLFMFNTFWNLNSDYKPIDDKMEEIELRVSFQPIGMMKFTLYSSWEARGKQQYSFVEMEQDDGGDDSLKTALIETNPILLGITMVVSMLHMVFEFLAFKNDIQFWNTRKDLAGLSVKTVLFNIFQSLVVFLYVCDNETTNFMIKMSTGIGLLIECWKIPKVLDVKVDHTSRFLGLIPRIRFSDKGSYVESETKVYDEMAFKYLSWVVFPLLFAYSGYSLFNYEYKSWCSFVLSLLYGFLLTFGFIAMTPQLFINYKLKSVAHLPWRMMTYKFINTFIDDLFAFITRMPLLYRISCFRDDIIFLIYLYQRWIYRVDPKRVNEFGYSSEEPVPDANQATECQESKKDK